MDFEFAFLDWLQTLHTPVGDFCMKFFSMTTDAGIIWIALALVLMIMPKTRKCGFAVAAALIVDLILCNGVLKNIFARVRPYDINTQVQILVTKPTDFSFPSGHSAASFAAVTAMFFGFRPYKTATENGVKKETRKLAAVLMALFYATLVAFSRMYLYVHYPTDIAGGIAAGILSGYIGFVIVYKLFRQKPKQE